MPTKCFIHLHKIVIPFLFLTWYAHFTLLQCEKKSFFVHKYVSFKQHSDNTLLCWSYCSNQLSYRMILNAAAINRPSAQILKDMLILDKLILKQQL